MALREIKTYPDPILATTCLPVEEIDGEARALAEDMIETMYQANGLGLAAPQVGSTLRLIVVDSREDEQQERGTPLVLINPEICEASGEIIHQEGCLSVPEYYADVKRAENVVVKGSDLDGKPMTLEARGIMAVCFQHEIDHLDGTLFLDHLSPLKRSLYKRRRAKELKREGQ
jgi:peptide deformylase